MKLKMKLDMSYMPRMTMVSVSLEGDGAFSGLTELLHQPKDIENLLKDISEFKEQLEWVLEEMNKDKEEKH